MAITYADSHPIVPNSPLQSSPVNDCFLRIQTAYNNHTNNTTPADQHYDSAVLTTTLPQTATVNNTGGISLLSRLDQFAIVFADLMDRAGGGTWADKYQTRKTNSYLDLKTVNNLLTAYNASTNPTGMTSTAVASTLVQRDANGGAGFKGLTSTSPAAGTAAVVASGATGDPTQFIFAVTKNDGVTSLFTVNQAGNGAFTGAVSATSFSGNLSGNVTGNVTGSISGGTVAGSTGTFSGNVAVSGTLSAGATTVSSIHNTGNTQIDGTLTVTGTITGTLSGNASSATTANSATTATTATTANGVAAGAVTSAGLAAGAVTSTAIAAGAVGATQIAAGAVGSTQLANNAVGTTQIADGSITNSKIATGAISQDKLLEGAILPNSPADKTVIVNALHKWNANGSSIYFSGGSIDLSSYIPVAGSGQSRYVLLEVNSTPVLLAKPGNTTTSALTDTDRPTADPNTTPVGFVALTAGQSQITAANIYPWVGLGGFPNSSVSGGSAIGHIHGISPESRLPALSMDEGFPAPTSTPGAQISIGVMHYRSSSGVVGSLGPTTFGAFSAPATGYRTYGVYFDPSTSAFGQTAPSDSASYPPSYPTFSGNQRSICYVHLTSTTPIVIKATNDNVNGWIEDARTWLAGSAPTSTPVGVSDGGTGQSAYGTAGLLFANGTNPFTTIAASTSVATPLAIAPTSTPSTGNGVGTNFGATFATGTSNPAVIATTSFSGPTKTGTGTAAGAYTLYAAGPGSGMGTTTAVGYFVTAVAASLGLIVDSVSGQTGKLQSWRVNGAEVAYISPAGQGAFTTLSTTAANSGGIVQEAWTAPTLLNSWTNNALGYGGVGYMKDAMGFIHLRGQIVGGAANSTAFSLGAGYAPAGPQAYAVLYYTGAAWQTCDVVVLNTGAVNPEQASVSGTMVGLNGILFDTR